MNPICPVCEIEMELKVVPFGLGGVFVKDTPYFICPNVDECGQGTPQDMDKLRKHYLYLWDTGNREITYGDLR